MFFASEEEGSCCDDNTKVMIHLFLKVKIVCRISTLKKLFSNIEGVSCIDINVSKVFTIYLIEKNRRGPFFIDFYVSHTGFNIFCICYVSEVSTRLLKTGTI